VSGVTLTPLPRDRVDRVAHLTLPPFQADFVGAISEMVDEPDPLQEFHVIRHGAEIVGFFKIDRDFSRRIAHLPVAAHALRGLLIGGQYQRRGFGQAALAALKDYARTQYDTPALWLSVDDSNQVAIALYQRNGWQANGAPYQGRVGLERVMTLPLR